MASSKIFPIYTSDHKPILLELSMGKNIGPIPFRFSPIWIQQEGFMDVVSSAWNRQIQCSPFYVWEEKLRVLKKELKKWAKSLITPTAKRKEAQAALESHHLIMGDTEIS